jgi:pentatricopeptide repeat domain-containing protein 1
MVENGVQLTLTSTLKSTGKAKINGEGLSNGSHEKVSIEKHCVSTV